MARDGWHNIVIGKRWTGLEMSIKPVGIKKSNVMLPIVLHMTSMNTMLLALDHLHSSLVAFYLNFILMQIPCNKLIKIEELF